MFGRVIFACVLSACYYTAWSSPSAATSVPAPVFDCGLNQVYTACEPACGKVNISCGDLKKKTICDEKTTDDKCSPSCICKEGFYRNENYECVAAEYCYKCEKPNEVFACGSACDSECSALGKACEIVNIACNKQCYCKNGYARNNERECVPYSECQDAPKCNSNEEYNCHHDCPPKVCFSIYARFKCSQNRQCQFKCDCKDGFLRNKANECITIEQCLAEH